MAVEFDRRTALRAALASAAAAGLGIAPPAHAATTGALARRRTDPPLPDVPGMSGNRRANEFWFQYDERFLYDPSPEILDAFAAIEAALGSVEEVFHELWTRHRAAGTYPAGYAADVAPARAPLAIISRRERELVDEFYRHDRSGLERAFVDFGQGVLYDPRRPVGKKVHMMDYGLEPPVAYHYWHAILRAKTLLGVDARRSLHVDSLVGLAWAVQSIAKPVKDVDDNPPLPPRRVGRLKRTWLRLTPDQLDVAFDSSPYPPGVS